MSDRELLQQALDTLEALQGGCTDSEDGTVEAITVWCPELIDALRAALAQPEAEPVAYGMRNDDGQIFDCVASDERERARYRSDYTVPLYATPQQAQPATAATSMDYGMFIDERTNPPAQPAPAVREPLTDEQIDALWRAPMSADWEHLEFARAIEAHHGITGDSK